MSLAHGARIATLALAVGIVFANSTSLAQPAAEGEDSVVTDREPAAEADASAPQAGGQNLQVPPTPNNLQQNQPTPPSRQTNRTRARQASQRNYNRSAPQNFNIRLSRAPKMLGDFFGQSGLCTYATVMENGHGGEIEYHHNMKISLPSPSAGDIIGRVRLQDNNSPIPQDRVFFDYNFFHNVPFTSNGVDVNRFTPGLEKTFWNKMASIELRVPMGATLDSEILTDGQNAIDNFEFGNMAIAAKFLLTSSDECALAAGVGVGLPTADDFELNMVDGTKLIKIQNDSAHVIPYLAYLYTPRGHNCFFQSFLTFDFDTNGNPVYMDNGGSLERASTWHDQHLASLSVQAGSWLFENYSRWSRVKRVAWSVEAHYTATISDADTLPDNIYVTSDPNADISLVNGTFGGHITVHQTTFTVGYTVPFTKADRVFDGEFRFFANRAF